MLIGELQYDNFFLRNIAAYWKNLNMHCLGVFFILNLYVFNI